MSLLVFGTSILFGQKSNNVPVVDKNNNDLSHAWAGGLNSPQFCEVDLNSDGIKDLFVFDREGDRVLTFVNNGTPNTVDYSYAPEYESAFPNMRYWVRMADYNNDGKNDIFTYNNGGIMVYKNTSSVGNLNFTVAVSPYLTSYFSPGVPASNIYVSAIDIPAIVDVDFDGDIDVLSFGLNSASMTFYENFAQDSGTIETFKFHDNTYCWGNFEEDALTNAIMLNQPCPKVKAKAKGNKHGGATILAFDPDADSDIDLLVGDPSFKNLVFLENGGNGAYADMVAYDDSFPSYNSPIDLQIFPGAYYLDVNYDGLKDLIVTPSYTNSIQNFKGVLYYQNIGTSSNAIFSLIQDDFLQESMLDFGTNAYPHFLDYNFDGLTDIIVGNGGYFLGQGLTSHRLALLENIGSATNPKFKLVDDDYANISQYNLNTIVNKPTLHPVPTIGDINNDGFKDLFIGDFQGRLHYFQNEPVGGISNFVFTEVNFKSIDADAYASPYIIDLDEDGLNDIVIGKKNGRVNYYRNLGTKEDPDFDSIPDNNKLGNVNTKAWNDYDGFSQASFFKATNNLFFISGSKSGTLFKYEDVKSNVSGDFTLSDTSFLGIDVGNRSHVAIGDINNDGMLDLIIGNTAGGLNLYFSDQIVGLNKHNDKEKSDLKIIPLGNRRFEMRISKVGYVNAQLYSITGKQISSFSIQNGTILDLSSYAGGLYIIRTEMDDSIETQKIILSE